MVKFSIIITTRNRRDLFERAFQSALRQNFNDYEIVVVNNGEESIEDIIEKYKSLKNIKIKLINYNQETSPYISANLGIKNSEGEWICFLDDDDELKENYLETINNYIDENVKWIVIRAIFTDGQHFKVFPEPKKIYQQLSKNFYKENLKNCYLYKYMSIIKKEVYLNLGLFDAEIPYGEDYEFHVRMAKNNFKPKLIEDPPLYIYHIHENQITRTKKFSLVFQKIYEKYKEDIEKDKEILSSFYYHIGWHLVRENNEKEAAKFFWKAFLLKPNYKAFLRFLFALLRLNKILKIERIINKVTGKFWNRP